MEEQKKSSNNKIILGILLLLLIGLGVYTFTNNKKHVEAENFLKEEKVQILGNLTAMEEKYDLAIASNTSMSEELTIERDNIIAFKDSIKNLKGTNFRLIRRYRGQIAGLEKTNTFFNEDWKSYKKAMEAIKLSPFKTTKSFVLD